MTTELTPTLTISITTRNRADLIGTTLESILPQLSDETELLILDGASTDDTEAVIEAYRLRVPALRYIRRHELYGPDRDFSHSVEQATGNYCWLMTDDDLLLPGAVAAVLGATRSDPSLIVVNAEVRNADFSKLLEARRLPFTENRTLAAAEAERLFVETASYLSFIGGVVIRRSIWLERERERYFGSLFIHIGVIFQQPLSGTTVVLAEPLVSIRYGNAQWLARQFEIWMLKWPELIWSFEHFSKAARSAVSPQKPWRNVIRLLFYRAKGAYSLQEYCNWVQPRTGSLWERLVAGSVALTPRVLANFVMIAGCLVSPQRPGRGKAGRGQQLLDLRSSPYYFPNWMRRVVGHRG